MSKILVTEASLPEYEKYCEKIKLIWENHWLTNNGVMHKELEEELKKYLGVKNVTLFTNGHLSLEMAIQLMKFPAGSEVITTPFTFISTTHAISRNNLVPVFCDIKPDDYTIDADKIEALITDKTVAIMPVHVYGHICDVEKIEALAKKYNLKVIYDAAHAFGVKYKNESIVNYGDISMFSFHATKVFNTIEGGALVYKNPDYKQELDYLKNFGITDPEHVDYIGGNAKMNEFQAAMGLCNLEKIDDNILKRKALVELYNSLLADVNGISYNEVQKDVKSNYAYYPIVVGDDYGLSRDELYDLLAKYDIYSRKYFYPISNEFDCYKECIGFTPVAKNISERVITLPLYPTLGEDNVKKICKIISEKR